MKKALSYTLKAGLLALALLGQHAQAQIVTYNPTGLTGVATQINASGVNANITATPLTRGTGITGVSAGDGLNSSGFDNSSSLATSNANGDYYAFTLTPAANYSIGVTAVSATGQRSSSNTAQQAQWSYVQNSATTALGTAVSVGSSNTAIAASSLSISGVTTSIQFRINGWNGSSGGTFRMNPSETVTGSVTLRSAGTLLWDGGQGNGDWNSYNGTAANQSNWNLNNIPLTSGDSLQFAGSSQTTTNNNMTGLTVASITFNSGAGAFTNAGNSLTLNGGVTNSSSSLQTISHAIVLSSGDHTFTGATGNLSVGGAISGGGNLIKTGANTLTLTGANTFTGSTTISVGTLTYGASNILTSAIYVNGGALNIAGFTDTVAGVTLASGTILGTSGALTSTATFDVRSGTVSAVLAGSAGLTKTTSGVVTLGGANTYTGVTTVTVGTLALGASNVLADTSTINVNGGELSIGASSDTVAGVTLTSGTIAGSTGALTSTAAFDVRSGTIGARLAGSAGLTKTTSGVVTLGGANTYTGVTAVNVGTLALGASNVLADGSTINVNGGELSLGASNDTVAGVTLTSGTIAGSTGALTSTTAFDVRLGKINAILAGSVGLTKSGIGLVSLSGGSANTYSGTTIVSGGELDLGKSAGVTAVAGNVSITSGTLKLLADEQIADTSTISLSSGALALNGATETITSFANSGGVFTTGAGHLIGTGATITWSGGTNTVNSGGLVEDAHFVITGGVNTVEGGGTLQLNSGGAGLEMTGGNLTLNSSETTSGKLVLNGDVTSHASGVTSTISNGGNASVSGQVDLGGDTRTFAVENGAATVDMAVSAEITNGSLTKSGAGVLELSGANTYSGATVINQGTLKANSADALGATTAVTVAEGGLLQVSVSDAVNDAATITLSGGTILRDGGVSETFGDLTMTENSTLDFGSGAIGTLTFGEYVPADGLILAVTNFAGGNMLVFASDLRNYFTEGGTSSSNFNFGSQEIESGWNGSQFTIVAVPETSTVVAGALMLGFLLWPQRRRMAALWKTAKVNS